MTSTATRRVDRTRAVTAARAVLAAVFALVVTLSADALGKADTDDAVAAASLAFGAFAVLHGLVIAFGTTSVPTSTGRLLQGGRAGVAVLFGLLALLLSHAGLGALLLVVTVAFLLTGVLELLLGVRRPDVSASSRDRVAMGVLSLVVGVLLSLFPPDVTVVVGVLAAWAAVSAVYLGIAAVSLGTGHRR